MHDQKETIYGRNPCGGHRSQQQELAKTRSIQDVGKIDQRPTPRLIIMKNDTTPRKGTEGSECNDTSRTDYIRNKATPNQRVENKFGATKLKSQ